MSKRFNLSEPLSSLQSALIIVIPTGHLPPDIDLTLTLAFLKFLFKCYLLQVTFRPCLGRNRNSTPWRSPSPFRALIYFVNNTCYRIYSIMDLYMLFVIYLSPVEFQLQEGLGFVCFVHCGSPST